MSNARQTGAVLEAHFQFMQWLFPAISAGASWPAVTAIAVSPAVSPRKFRLPDRAGRARMRPSTQRGRNAELYIHGRP